MCKLYVRMCMYINLLDSSECRKQLLIGQEGFYSVVNRPFV